MYFLGGIHNRLYVHLAHDESNNETRNMRKSSYMFAKYGRLNGYLLFKRTDRVKFNYADKETRTRNPSFRNRVL